MPILELKELSKHFGELKAVDGFTLDVDEGELVGIIGPNGAGKTTLFNLITGNLDPTSGKVIFKGEDITGDPVWKRVRKGIVRVFQSPWLFNELSGLQNIQVARWRNQIFGGSERDIPEVVEEEGLEEKILDTSPRDLPLLDVRKIEFAQKLASGPDFILLDEIFAGLNPDETAELQKMAMDYNEKGATFLIIDHNLKALKKVVERVAVMHRGAKIAEGSYEEVTSDEHVKDVYMRGG